MRSVAITSAALSLAGCDDVLWRTIPAGDETIAQECEADLEEFKRAKRDMRAAEPYAARDVGECTVMRNDGRLKTLIIYKTSERAKR